MFWCAQSLPKYLPQYDQVFPRIARDAGDCQFTFIQFPGGAQITALFRQRLERAFAAFGLNAADHCVFLPRLEPQKFVAAIGACDAVLDSIGWSGCNSVLESLVHDLPIVTLSGSLMRGRHATAILTMMDVRGHRHGEYRRLCGGRGADRARCRLAIFAAQQDRQQQTSAVSGQRLHRRAGRFFGGAGAQSGAELTGQWLRRGMRGAFF